MTAKNPIPTTRRRHPFSSIGAKITMMLVAMGATLAMAGLIVIFSFQQITNNINQLSDEKLPQLDSSSRLIRAATLAKDAMVSALLAQDQAALDASEASIQAASTELTSAQLDLPDAVRSELDGDVKNTVDTLDALVRARKGVFRNADWIEQQTAHMQALSESIQVALTEAADTAYFDLTMGGEATIAEIDDTLTMLVEEQFAALQSLLEARAEINLLSGITLGVGTTRDPSTLSILNDLATASSARLGGVIETLASSDVTTIDVEPLARAKATFDNAVMLGWKQTEAVRQDLLQARRSADVVLTTAVDDMLFSLTIAADEASTDNASAIQSLLDKEVGFLNTLLEINGWISRLQVATLDVLVANDLAETKAAANPMIAATEALSGYKEFSDGIISDDLTKIIALSDLEQGLPAFRMAYIQANAAAIQEAENTAAAVLSIASQAARLGEESQSAISELSTTVASEVEETQNNLHLMMGASAVIFLIALIFNKILILNPLRSISETTERLAQGDLKPVTGFERSSDEINRIAVALAVFRDGLVEKEDMSKRADSERKARMEEQQRAVDAIGAGLSRLSDGDLTTQIDDEMSEGYAQLRDDFNKTLQTLTHTVSRLMDSSISIGDGSLDIRQASDDLSQRTENQAATLEQTAAALDELTASVRSAADGARSVETTVQAAKAEAETSETVVQNAVAAMNEIEGSSSEISQIVSVIDDIAFQTNLLALNAGVEAARAGEAGKGFAVVASEVRALAQRSSESAMEIKTLIENSSVQVDRGVDLVGKAGDALHSILNQIGKISHLVSGIAEVAVEQSTGLDEINTGMAHLDRVTQQNAAMVQETTASSRKLQSNSEEMTQLVKYFRTGTERRPSVPRAPLVDANESETAPLVDANESETEVTASPVETAEWIVEAAEPAPVPEPLPMKSEVNGEVWSDF